MGAECGTTKEGRERERGGLCPTAQHPQFPEDVRPAGGSVIDTGVADKRQLDCFPPLQHPPYPEPSNPIVGAAKHDKSRCLPLPEDISSPVTAPRPAGDLMA